jgi:hypothetical protein
VNCQWVVFSALLISLHIFFKELLGELAYLIIEYCDYTMHILSNADQVQNLHNLYTQILMSNWRDLSDTKPEGGWEVLAKGKYEMHMFSKHTRTSMNKDNKEHMYQGTWKGFGT